MGKRSKSNKRKSKKSKKHKKYNLNKLAKESIINDNKLKKQINECMVKYAKTEENMKLTKKISELSKEDKTKLSEYIKKEKKRLKKKTKSKRIRSGAFYGTDSQSGNEAARKPPEDPTWALEALNKYT